jgi:hypothetical protein
VTVLPLDAPVVGAVLVNDGCRLRACVEVRPAGRINGSTIDRGARQSLELELAFISVPLPGSELEGAAAARVRALAQDWVDHRVDRLRAFGIASTDTASAAGDLVVAGAERRDVPDSSLRCYLLSIGLAKPGRQAFRVPELEAIERF